MAQSKTLSVSILDKQYQVSCAEEEVAALQKSAAYLDQKMREMKEASNVFGLDRLAIMAALNLTNDLLAQSEKASELDTHRTAVTSELDQHKAVIAELTSRVDSALDRLRPKVTGKR